MSVRNTMPRAVSRRFPAAVLEAVSAAKVVGVRAGAEHRFTRVWVVVARGRVFVRSWNDKAHGWYRAFVGEPEGAIQLLAGEIAVRARKVRGPLLLDAIDRAYEKKYHTKASLKWVVGFRVPSRRATTLELVPR